MQIYLVTDEKQRVHQFIYPDRIWERGDAGWYSRTPQKSDHKDRLTVCLSLVKNAISAQRLGSTLVEETEKEPDYAVH